MRILFLPAAIAAGLLVTPAVAKPFAEMFPGVTVEDAAEQALLEAVDYKQGTVTLPGGMATLEVPDGFFYLDPVDAETLLVDLWGNPPGDPSLGVIMPAQYVMTDRRTWAAEIDWDPSGYVSDEDAGSIDYDDLVRTMQDDVIAENDWRVSEGYAQIMLIGWAAAPYYDQEARKLHWAQELKFGNQEINTLNYEIRVLGRRGVLVMTFIADMSQLAEIDAVMPDVLAMSAFTEGNTYADFDPSVDQVAAFGIAGLIAGKALLKTGALPILLLVLKKFWFVIPLGIAAVWRTMTA